MAKIERLTLLKPKPYTKLQAALDAFMLSRQAMRCTPKTLQHYEYTLANFAQFVKTQGVDAPEQITPSHIRAFLVSLQRKGLKDTTQHAHARAIRTWMRWLVNEGEIAQNPMQKVAMPRLEQRIPAPFSPDDIRKLLAVCDRKTVKGLRDYAIILGLLDSGLRLSEFASLKVGDVNMRTGLCTVMGKGRKMRQVRFGAKARAAIAKYLAASGLEPGQPLWGLTAWGLQVMLHRLGKRAGVMPCGAHRFRRTFAIWALRNGMDLHSLRMLMGHSDLTVLQRYLALAGEDIERAHRLHSPADNMLAWLAMLGAALWPAVRLLAQRG